MTRSKFSETQAIGILKQVERGRRFFFNSVLPESLFIPIPETLRLSKELSKTRCYRMLQILGSTKG